MGAVHKTKQQQSDKINVQRKSHWDGLDVIEAYHMQSHVRAFSLLLTNSATPRHCATARNKSVGVL